MNAADWGCASECAREAIERAGRFVPTVVALVPSLELLVLVRNGVAHLGEATADDGDDVLVPYLKASEELRGALDLDREAYWGEFVELVDSALKENVEKARLRAESALAIARQEFEKRFGALDEPTRTAMLRVVENNPEKYDEQLIDCPACGTQALVFGSVKVEFDEDWDYHEGVLLGVHPISCSFRAARAATRADSSWTAPMRWTSPGSPNRGSWTTSTSATEVGSSARSLPTEATK